MSVSPPKVTNKQLTAIAAKIKGDKALTPQEVEHILKFDPAIPQGRVFKILSKIALPGSILLGSTMAIWPEFYAAIVKILPEWTNMEPHIMRGVDYVWDILGDPVKKPNIIYHFPHVIMYSFGVVGIRKLYQFVEQKTWLDRVIEAKTSLEKLVEKGDVNYRFRPGHSILFVGNGDFIAEQFTIQHPADEVIILSSRKPAFTVHWLSFDMNAPFDSLVRNLNRAHAKDCGEYLFFPVTDTHLFLPGPNEYDLSPEKVEVMVQSLRDIEKTYNWGVKRIIVVGDRKQVSYIQTETKDGLLEDTRNQISLEKIDKRYQNVDVLDASDLVAKEILRRFPHHRIFFRSSQEGNQTYKKRFYARLEEHNYKDDPQNEHSVVIGYDLQEEQIKRESILTGLQSYLPVVLSREVHDAILRNGHTAESFIYVPELVLAKLKNLAKQQ